MSLSIEKQKQSHDKTSKTRTFAVGDLVYIRDFPSGKSWLPGGIDSASGLLTFWIKLSDGCYFRRHIDHMRACSASDADPTGLPKLVNFVCFRKGGM